MTRLIHPDRAAWLAWRAADARIGASEAAAVLGASRYTTPVAWWAERTGRATRRQTAAMADGLAWERVGRMIYADRMPAGLRYSDDPEWTSYVHPVYPWLHATPDAVLLEESGQVAGLLEMKTDRSPGAADAWPADGYVMEGPPADAADPAAWPVAADYWLQVQIQLACTGAQWCDLQVAIPEWGAAVAPTRHLRILPCDIGPTLAVLADLRQHYLIDGEEPPPASDEEIEALARWRYPVRAAAMQADAEQEEHLRAAIAARAQAKAADAAFTHHRAALVVSMGDAARLVGRCGVLTIGKNITIKENP